MVSSMANCGSGYRSLQPLITVEITMPETDVSSVEALDQIRPKRGRAGYIFKVCVWYGVYGVYGHTLGIWFYD